VAYRIKINKRFRVEAHKVYEYLAEEWSFTIADEFIEKVYARIYQLADTPNSGFSTPKHKNVRRINVTKHNKLYYRVKGRTITILSLFPSKQDPRKNKYE
jgi:plasmid stabilization system protein ParE